MRLLQSRHNQRSLVRNCEHYLETIMIDETTTEQLAEIEGQATDYTPPDGWRLLEVHEEVDIPGRDQYVLEARRYIRRIEQQPQPQPEPQPVPQPQPEPEPQPIQVCEGRWKTRGGDIRNVTATPEGDERGDRWPWWDAAYCQTWRANGRYHFGGDSPLDLVEYLGSFEPQPERSRNAAGTEPEPDAETIGELKEEARILNMEIGGLERQLAVVKEQLTTAAAVCQQLQIELDAALQVPADSPELRQLRLDLAEVTRERDQYRDAYDRILADLETIRETTAADTVETIVEWLEPFRGCNSPSLALLLIEALPHIMRSLTGLADEEIE